MERGYGMTINEWLNENFKHITLYDTIVKAGNILKVPEINTDLTVGLISTNNKEEFAKLVFNYVPVGTIIEPIDDDWYECKLLAVRNMLTKRLLTDGKARHFLDILERRDKERWSKEPKQLKVEQRQDKSLNITFDIV